MSPQPVRELRLGEQHLDVTRATRLRTEPQAAAEHVVAAGSQGRAHPVTSTADDPGALNQTLDVGRRWKMIDRPGVIKDRMVPRLIGPLPVHLIQQVIESPQSQLVDSE
jgi:hypothetical protein